MQLGVSLSEYEIKELIRHRVGELTGENPEDLDVHVTCWNGRLSTVTTHIDGDKDVQLKDKA